MQCSKIVKWAVDLYQLYWVFCQYLHVTVVCIGRRHHFDWNVVDFISLENCVNLEDKYKKLRQYFFVDVVFISLHSIILKP